MSSPDIIHDTQLKHLYAYWDAKRRGRPMPHTGDLALADLGPLLSKILWVEVEQEPRRYRYRRVGAEFDRIYGFSVHGLYVDEMPGFLHRLIASRAYAEVVERREPVCRTLRISMMTWSVKYERLLLPVSSAGERVDFVLGAISPEYGTAKPA